MFWGPIQKDFNEQSREVARVALARSEMKKGTRVDAGTTCRLVGASKLAVSERMEQAEMLRRLFFKLCAL
jgi:hypothetical protein